MAYAPSPAYRSIKISTTTFKKIDKLSAKEQRTKKQIIERAIDRYSFDVISKEK